MSNARERAEARAEGQGDYDVPPVLMSQDQADRAAAAIAKVAADLRAGTSSISFANDLVKGLVEALRG